ncbi:MAG: T9SS type A sorting domain-containing protein [Thermonemataceae bacterium]|nr:T9SS type A sorting domain-containing protein [Thermonemataceae bacterium]
MKKILTLLFVTLLSNWAWGQEKCLSHVYEQELRAKYPQYMGTQEDFERILAQKIEERKRLGSAARTGPYTIPVIIHVIYNNSSTTIANNSVNIPYGQAASQIRVLNEDFQKTNPDFSANVRAVFQPYAGDMDVTFVAATKDPNGNYLTEPGVERINGEERFGVAAWSTDQCNSTLKPGTYWDPSKYFNFWVVKFSGSNDTGLFGYAQFPSMTPGWGTSGGADNTDGVVINWRATGSNYDAAGNALSTPYVSSANLICSNCDKGRTATHEIGHWLGLRHTWGDQSGCSGPNFDDYCDDTPELSGASPVETNCVTARTKNSCTGVDAFYGSDVLDQIENYMDYSADGCMGMFSADQVARMEAVMDVAPNRASLTTPANISAVAPTRPNDLYVTIYAIGTTSGKEGDNFSFQQASQSEGLAAINSYTWNFDVDGIGGVSPATFSGATPPAVTFGSVGTYKVQLTVSNGTQSKSSNIITVTTTLKGPSSLQFTNKVGTGAAAKVVGQADLQWVDNSTSEDNYIVERKKNSEPTSAYVTLATLAANTTTYSDVYSSTNSVENGQSYNYRVTAKKGSSTASVTATIKVEFNQEVTAIEDAFSKEVSLYPNPAQTSFQVDLSKLQVNEASMVLFNTLGQKIMDKTLSNGVSEINVSKMPKGMYLLKINTNKGVALKRVIVD